MSQSSTLLVHTASLISREVKELKELRKVRTQSVDKFAVDVALVACAIRTAYLVDAFSTPSSTLIQLLKNLRACSAPFLDVVIISDTSTDQQFLLNAQLFRERIEAGEHHDHTRFLVLEGDYPLCDIPCLTKAALDSILDAIKQPVIPACFSLADGLDQQSLVPLAGVLLEYPIAYVPTSDPSAPFLSQVPLDIYECVIEFGEDKLRPGADCRQHSLMKFSCPQSVGEREEGLGLSSLIDVIIGRFSRRIDVLGIVGVDVQVTHGVDIFDRVAFICRPPSGVCGLCRTKNLSGERHQRTVRLCNKS